MGKEGRTSLMRRLQAKGDGSTPIKVATAAKKRLSKMLGTGPAKVDHKAERVLLSKAFKPELYDLTIDTNMADDFQYGGQVLIHAQLAEAMSSITLHVKELHLEECKFVTEAGETIATHQKSYDVALNTVTIKFDAELPAGAGVLDISFTGTHNDQMCGFYRSTFKGPNGEDKVMLCSQFESLDARRCFPCVDEPAAKATFKATLIVDDGLAALSNMPVETESLVEDGKRRKVVFEETPMMSTYLLAFVVGDLDYIECKSKHGILIRVYTKPGETHLGEFALEFGADALDFYDDMFKQPYPLPKLDMVAVPDFAAGAMENWGLVTYRDVALLTDLTKASNAQKQYVAVVVAHELAHQWFGNLVTMEWWSSLWLNEGFASWMESHCIASLKPEWNKWEQFVQGDQAMALKLDALVSSHPIEVPIKHAKEVEQVFDGISYLKGASVVRLIHSFLGKEHFEQGLQVYMDRHKYSNAETTDLWQAWEDVSKKPVQKVMASWTDQMGFPVIVVKSMRWGKNNATVALQVEQKWFIGDGSEHPDSKNKLWSIPIIVTVGGSDGKAINLGIMDTRTAKIVIPVAARKKTWIKLNGDQHVPMRVNYDAVAGELGPLFNEAISSQEMSANDRVGLVSDYSALTKAGQIEPSSLIRLLAAYTNESSMPVIAALGTVLGELDTVLSNDPALSAEFKTFAAKLISGPSKATGWDARADDGHLTTLMRSSLISLQASYMAEDEDVQREAFTRFEQWISDPVQNSEVLPSTIRSAVLKIVLSTSEDEIAFEQLLDLAEKTTSSQEKNEIFAAIGFVKSPELKRKVLEWSYFSGAVRLQDVFYPVRSVSMSSLEGLELCWSYLQEHFTEIIALGRTAHPSITSGTVNACCRGFATTDRADEIEAFFKVHQEQPLPQISRSLDQLIEGIRASAKFLNILEKDSKFAKSLSSL
mmetsp:Transcript_20016/g.35566  ORF Transcript_20016/g.35566 Transcript_20016/m.35566 type:complete len:936 (-) Transcript_20016:55-2862(-)